MAGLISAPDACPSCLFCRDNWEYSPSANPAIDVTYLA
jgi:hypothetical protein